MSPVSGTLQSGTYVVSNVASGRYAALRDANRGSPITASNDAQQKRIRKEKRKEEKKIERAEKKEEKIKKLEKNKSKEEKRIEKETEKENRKREKEEEKRDPLSEDVKVC
jgi:hypothetical protein